MDRKRKARNRKCRELSPNWQHYGEKRRDCMQSCDLDSFDPHSTLEVGYLKPSWQQREMKLGETHSRWHCEWQNCRVLGPGHTATRKRAPQWAENSPRELSKSWHKLLKLGVRKGPKAIPEEGHPEAKKGFLWLKSHCTKNPTSSYEQPLSEHLPPISLSQLKESSCSSPPTMPGFATVLRGNRWLVGLFVCF